MVMFFGMCNSLGTFQQIMNDIFTEHQINFLIIYMDELLVCMKGLPKSKHATCVIKVLQKLQEYDLFLKVLQYTFFKEQVFLPLNSLSLWILS